VIHAGIQAAREIASHDVQLDLIEGSGAGCSAKVDFSAWMCALLGNAPRFLQCLDVEKPQGAQMVGHCPGRQLLHGEELGLVLPNVLPTQAVRRGVEVLCESFDEPDVTLCGSLRVMTTLEFFQHDSA